MSSVVPGGGPGWLTVHVVQRTTSEIHSLVTQTKEADDISAMEKWLDPPDPSTNYNEATQSRHPGTGQWLRARTSLSARPLSRSPLLCLGSCRERGEALCPCVGGCFALWTRDRVVFQFGCGGTLHISLFVWLARLQTTACIRGWTDASRPGGSTVGRLPLRRLWYRDQPRNT